MSEYVYDMGDYHDPIREKIVRCRDCKHYGCKWISKEVTPYFGACYRLHAIEFMVEPDGFCAWAERRDA